MWDMCLKITSYVAVLKSVPLSIPAWFTKKKLNRDTWVFYFQQQ